MERPKCEWNGVDKCQRPATHMVGFVHSDKFRLSCKEHAENWRRQGRGYWVGSSATGTMSSRTSCMTTSASAQRKRLVLCASRKATESSLLT
jgi:hypothetical protein